MQIKKTDVESMAISTNTSNKKTATPVKSKQTSPRKLKFVDVNADVKKFDSAFTLNVKGPFAFIITESGISTSAVNLAWHGTCRKAWATPLEKGT